MIVAQSANKLRKNDSDESLLTAEAQMAILWRILHLMVSRYGNHPMGQVLVALTMIFLNDRGKPPTLTDICEATGLPKASVSRYVSWQLSQGFAKEKLDPEDRRRRLLVQTAKGRKEWEWQVEQMEAIFQDIDELDYRLRDGNLEQSGEDLLKRMRELTKSAPERRW